MLGLKVEIESSLLTLETDLVVHLVAVKYCFQPFKLNFQYVLRCFKA